MKKAEKECERCGAVFEAERGKQRLCESCRGHRAARAPIKEKRRSSDVKGASLDEICRELAEYNRKNGTFVSYGQWVVMRNEKKKRRGGKGRDSSLSSE